MADNPAIRLGAAILQLLIGLFLLIVGLYQMLKKKLKEGKKTSNETTFSYSYSTAKTPSQTEKFMNPR